MNENKFNIGEFLTKSEAAARLRVSELTVSRLIAAGKLTAYKVGRRVVVPQQSVTRLLENSEKKKEGTLAAA